MFPGKVAISGSTLSNLDLHRIHEVRGGAMYVILGATGNTGSVAARRLLDKAKKVRVMGGSLRSDSAGDDTSGFPGVSRSSDGVHRKGAGKGRRHACGDTEQRRRG